MCSQKKIYFSKKYLGENTFSVSVEVEDSVRELEVVEVVAPQGLEALVVLLAQWDGLIPDEGGQLLELRTLHNKTS